MSRLLTGLCLVLFAGPAFAQPKAVETFPPDAETLKQIETKTAELRTAVGGLPEKTPADVRADVDVYLKAAEWIVRHGEWFQKDSGKQTLTVLAAGLERAKAAADGRTPWRDVRGRPVVRGYVSRVDGSVQPFAVTLPEGYGERGKLWRLDVVLHGRDGTLTEVKFINAREMAKPGKGPDHVVIEPYGRGNNAYRWAGETDVFEASDTIRTTGPVDPTGVVLRGFSMGGAGTWHIGLHHPREFAVIGPGAGFTTTKGYVKNLPAELPTHQERCLTIYDAVNWAENVANVPVVAYSGEVDPQKAAADNIERALRGFPEEVRFTHVVAPGLEHRQPPEWQAKLDAEYRKHLPRSPADRVRFVTYTTRYDEAGEFTVYGLDRHYDKAVVDARWGKDRLDVRTANVRVLGVSRADVRDALDNLARVRDRKPEVLVIDGQRLPWPKTADDVPLVSFILAKVGGNWERVDGFKRLDRLREKPEKSPKLQGPIDDAFLDPFAVVRPTGQAAHPAVGRYTAAAADRFGRVWDKFFRGNLPTLTADEAVVPKPRIESLVLFGDPASNPVIAKIADKLPITWTREKLVVNGVEYDPATHVPVLIYTNPLNPTRYVVINSGHTFGEADLRGTNALLYPRLGDWAVLKVAPTEKDPAAAEVVAAGLFDEFWQFPKK
jgi:hypothetical protein